MALKEREKQRYILLDGLRGLAALIIAPFHLWLGNKWYHGGSVIFVDFFFVLSGFVLAPQLLNKGKSTYKRFLVNRILRLYPMLIPVFIFIIMIEQIPFIHSKIPVGLNPVNTPINYFAAFLLLQIFIGHLVSVHGALWSLSAEWFVNIVSIKIFPKGKKMVALIFCGYILEIIAIYLNHRYELGWSLVKYLTAAGRAFVGFYLGLYLRSKNLSQARTLEKKYLKHKIILSLFLTALNFYLMSKSEWFILLSSLNFYWFISLISRINEINFPPSFRKICSYLGRISYGIYIWNIPIARLNISSFMLKYLPIPGPGFVRHTINVIIASGLILLATEFSIRFFEIPIKDFARRKMTI